MSRHFLQSFRNRRYLVILAVFVVFFSLLLSACGVVEQDVTLAKNEKWNAETRVTIPQETLTFTSPADIEDILDQAKAKAEAANLSYKRKKKVNDDGSLTYIINTSGEGYNLLNDALFDSEATIRVTDEDGTTEFSYIPYGDFNDYALTLHVGEVLETNGVVSGKGEVSWHGLGQQMYAVFKPKSGLDIKWLLVGAGILIMLIGAAVLLPKLRGSSRSRPPAPYASSFSSSAAGGAGKPRLNYCHRCGGKLDPNGVFCPHCGAPQT